MLKISFIIFLISCSIFSVELKVGQVCNYRFYADGAYPGSLKMELIKIEKDSYTIMLTQKMGAIQESREIKIKKDIPIENFIDEMLKITFLYNKKKIKILKKVIKDDYIYKYEENEYKGSRVEVDILLDKKRYTLTYTFSDVIPIMNLLRFSIIQDVRSKKKYKLENIILIKDYGEKGNLKKL